MVIPGVVKNRVLVSLSMLSLLGATASSRAEEGVLPIDDLEVIDEHEWVQAASRRRQSLGLAPSPTIVLSDLDIRSTPAVSLPDRLRYVPGVDVYQSRHGQFDVGMRGWNGQLNNQLLVVEDGRELRQEEFGAGTWIGPIFTSDIQRVEVVKGPASVTYGSNAFGGVVALASRPVGDRPQAWVMGDVGTFGERSLDATFCGPLVGRTYYKISAGGTHLGDMPGVETGLVHQDSPRTADSGNTDLEALRTRGLLGVRIADEIRLEGSYQFTDLSPWELVDDWNTGSKVTRSRYHDLGGKLITPWGEVSHHRHLSDKAYENQKTVYIPTEDFRYTQAGLAGFSNTTRAQANTSAGRHRLSVGGEYIRWVSRSSLWGSGIFADRDTWSEVSTTNAAAFAEDQVMIARNLAVTAGLRGDLHSQAGSNLSPRAALNWQATKSQALLLSWSQGYRLPTPLESYLREFYFKSDPDLKAERITAVELGWRLKNAPDGIELGTNLFANRANNLIRRAPLSSAEMQANVNRWWAAGPDLTKQPGPYFVYTNIDNPATVLGLEGSARVHIPRTGFTPWGNATFQQFRYRDPVVYQSDGVMDPVFGRQFAYDVDLGREFNAPPRWKASIGLDMAVGGWTLGAASRLVAGRTVYSLGNSDMFAGILAVQDIPAYATLDASVGYQQRFANVTTWVRLAALDLFDTEHAEAFRTDAQYLTDYREQHNASLIGRQVVLQGGAEF